ncbi:MAG: sulfite exporter TauE/SafE family protein [Candidatus Omnitrophica bacterium]|nr:sulfite exporter TauE/SafE family protein [Candidatus Omnitrophota bacterium]
MNNRVFFELFLSGILLGAGPCLLSCGPILLSYIAGTKKTVPAGLFAYVLFSCSRIATYLILSALFFLIGRLFVESVLSSMSRYLLIALGSALLLLGVIVFFDIRGIKNRWCVFLSRYIIERDKTSLVALGLFAGLIPCGPFLAILTYIGLISSTLTASVAYSFVFGLGTFLSPLILLVLFTGWLPRLQAHYPGYYRFSRLISAGILFWLGLKFFASGLHL